MAELFAVFKGSISAGFSLVRLAKKDDKDAICEILQMEGPLDIVPVVDPAAEDKSHEPSDGGSTIVMIGDIGNGATVYGPFDDEEHAAQFAENTKNDWLAFTAPTDVPVPQGGAHA